MNSNSMGRLTGALDDEYKARASYRKVIETLGPIRPSSTLSRPRKVLSPPYSRFRPIWFSRTGGPLAGERDGSGHAGRGLPPCGRGRERQYGVVRALARGRPGTGCSPGLENLQSASRDRHLPAFERCIKKEPIRRLSDVRRGPETSRTSMRSTSVVSRRGTE